MADREFLLKVVGDVSNATKSLDKLSGDVDNAQRKISGAAKLIGGAFAVGAAVDFGKSLVDAASDQEQAFGAVNSVFGEYAKNIHDASAQAAQDVGLSTAQYENLATLTGALLKNAGVPLDEVAASAENLTKVGADLSAMYGGTAADAMGAINSALKGEMDPLEAFGVSLKASAIEAKAVSMGLVDASGKATDYGKKMATVTLIQEQSADAMGTFADEADSVAGRSQILKAQFTNLQAELGQKLLPYVVKFADVLVSVVSFIDRNQSWLIPTVAAIGAIVLAIQAWQLAVAAWTTIQEIATGVQLAFNVAMSANPIGLIVLAIAALVAGIVLAYKKVDWFREFVDASAKAMADAFMWIVDAVQAIWDVIQTVYRWIKDHWQLLAAILLGPFGIVLDVVIYNWDTIKRATQSVIDFIKAVFSTLGDAIRAVVNPIVDIVKGPFETAWRKISDITHWIVDAFGWVGDQIYNIMAGVADAVTAPFRGAINAIKQVWNSTVGGFGFTTPGWLDAVGLGNKSFKIPRMATGGIVTGPTIAMLGEAGREAVIPLDRAGSLGLGNVVINVYALTANAEVGRVVFNALVEYERSTGKSTGLTATTTTLVNGFAA